MAKILIFIAASAVWSAEGFCARAGGVTRHSAKLRSVVENSETADSPDRVLNIMPRAMEQLQLLKEKQGSEELVLRMGVRSGGCSGAFPPLLMG